MSKNVFTKRKVNAKEMATKETYQPVRHPRKEDWRVKIYVLLSAKVN